MTGKEIKAEIVREFRAGASVAELAARYRVAQSTVEQAIRETLDLWGGRE